MPRKVVNNQLNASTIDILNVIRANASLEYQNQVPKVEKAIDIPKVGEVLYGTPALANQFINALINRIALVRVQSANFYNPYAHLKKGYLEFGETIEDVFVSIAKVRDFDVEKAEAREFKRTLPDVRAAFYAINWRVQYPVTIQDTDLKTAFLSMDGVQDLIAKIVDSIYTAAEYDEYLLFKYLLIKGITHGKMKPVNTDTTNFDNVAIDFRGYANQLGFMSSDYNDAGVFTNTPRERLCIFMDSMFNARFDVSVLAAAFNMDKADFTARLHLIDSFDTFDNLRWSEIRAAGNQVEEVTAEELTLMKNVKAVLVDENWFQVYDNVKKFTEKFVAAGDYWNYFYKDYKTVASSPFANAIVFVDSAISTEPAASITVEVVTKSVGEGGTIYGLEVSDDNPAVVPNAVQFVQTQVATAAGIAVQKFGGVIMPPNSDPLALELTANGVTYTGASNLTTDSMVGDTITCNKAAARQAAPAKQVSTPAK